MKITSPITLGMELGIHPMLSIIPPKYQYKSRNNGKWKNCINKRDMLLYRKYHYEVREFFNN